LVLKGKLTARCLVVARVCGIAGIISLRSGAEVDRRQLSRMTDRLAHRGPDDHGYYISPDRRIGFGFRRLSIIDPVGSNQPICNENETIWVIANGEIYNYKSLRDRLERLGHRFRTSGDIESIVHLYEQAGVDFLNQLDGFFGLALADLSARRVVLAVDRFGKKPIYYTLADGAVYFASELKAITTLGLGKALDPAAVIDFLRFGWIPAPRTVYQNIFKLVGGHFLHVHLDFHRELPLPPPMPAVRYYERSLSYFTGTYGRALDRCRSLLSEAVAKRLIADVPLGVLLSGGLDSSIVTALAAQASPEPVRTFTVGFESDLYDERPHAAMVARRFKTEHTELVLKPDVEGICELVVSTFDEPFADSSAIPTYLICRSAAEHVKVALTGDGGDEAFCGYDRYRAAAIGRFLALLGGGHVGSLAAKLLPPPGQELRSTRTRIWRLITALRYTPADRYSMFLRVFYEHQLASLLGPELKGTLGFVPDFVAQAFDGCTALKSVVMRANHADYVSYLPYDLLVKADRSSMANGLEIRSPFLDHRLVEFAASLPLRWRTGLRRGKRILRDAFRDLVPGEILRSAKAGFGVPVGTWLRGPMRPEMESKLSPKSRLVTLGFVDGAALVHLQREHLAGTFDHGQRLWALMVLEHFLQTRS